MSMMTGVPSRVRPRPMWWSWPATRSDTLPWLTRSRRTRRCGSWLAGGGGFGSGLVGGGRGARASERCGRRRLYSSTNSSSSACSSAIVAAGGWAASQRLERLVEAFDFAAGRRMVRPAVLLDDAEAVEEVFEPVAAASAAGQAGGEHHSVVGQRRRRHTVCFQGVREHVDDDVAGHPAVGGDRDRRAGVVIDPAQDLHLGAVGETPVGEIGLPALVRQVSLEADIRRPWPLRRLHLGQTAASAGCDTPSPATRSAGDVGRGANRWCAPRHRDRATRARRAAAMISSTVADGVARGLECGRRDRGSNAASPSSRQRATRS